MPNLSVADILQGGELPEQDYIVLGGAKSPGKATIVGAGIPRKWDVREPNFMSGASCVYAGQRLSKFKVLIELWEPKSQLADWTRFAKVALKEPVGMRGLAALLANPTAAGTKALDSKALEIQHPLLVIEPLKITSVVVEDCSQFEVSDEGLYTCVLDLLEWRAPKFAGGKVNAAIPKAEKKIPTAEDAAEVEIGKLTAQLRGLAGS